MIVYVVMSNDFPHAVFSTKFLADEFVKAKQAVVSARWERQIYWKVYGFPLDKELAA